MKSEYIIATTTRIVFLIVSIHGMVGSYQRKVPLYVCINQN